MLSEPLLLELNNFRHCNLTCQYCSPKGEKQFPRASFDTQEFIKQTKSIITSVAEIHSVPMVKISGNGEVSLIEGFQSLLCRDTLNVLITNGTGSRRFHDQLLELKRKGYNMTIQFSLDGHTPEMNRLRVGNPHTHAKMLKNLSVMLENGFSIEVNMVLHRFNLPHIRSYSCWLESQVKRANGDLKLVPFPVRPFRESDMTVFKPDSTEVDKFIDEILGPKPMYEGILAPKPYLSVLADFLTTWKRKPTCGVANLGLFVDSAGNLNWCGCGAKRKYGDISQTGTMPLKKRVGDPFQGLEKNCAQCFNHYELLNLFFSNKIELNEMITMPSYKALEKPLKALKEKYEG